jgi:hypothetical protein
MRWRYFLGLSILVAVVAWGCSGCSDRERFNCIRVNNERVTTPTNVEVGTGRCA